MLTQQPGVNSGPAVGKIDRTGLVDIKSFEIDTNLSSEQRKADYLEHIKDSSCFLCGDTAVRVRFEPSGDELRSKLKSLFISLKKA